MKHCCVTYLLWLTIAVLGLGGALAGCGQKGGLYLPYRSQEPQHGR